MPKKTPGAPLTPREDKITALVASGSTVSSAIREVGGNPRGSSIRRRLRPGGDMYETLMRAWRKQGVTLTKVARRHREALDAEETKFFPTEAYPDCNEGIVIPRENVIAHGPRLQAVELAYKVAGVLGRDDRNDDPAPPDVHVSFTFNLGGASPLRDITPANGSHHPANGDSQSNLGPVLRSLGLTVRADRGNGAGGSDAGAPPRDPAGDDPGAGA